MTRFDALTLVALVVCLATGLVPRYSAADNYLEDDDDEEFELRDLGIKQEDVDWESRDYELRKMKRRFNGDDEDEEEDEEGNEEDEEDEEGDKGFSLPRIPPAICYRPAKTDPMANIASHIALDRNLSNGGRLIILDRLFTKEQLDALLGLMQSRRVTWLFTGLEQAEIQPSDFVRENKAPWTATIPSATLVQSQMWKTVRPVLETLYPGDGPLLLADATGYVFRWGDGLQPDLGNKDDDTLVVEIFFDSWVRNYYGETLLYDSNGAVCGGIHPRQGRLAVFPASARRLLHPPAIAYTSEQHMVELRMSRSTEGSYKVLQERERSVVAEIQKRSGSERVLFTDFLGKQSASAVRKNPADFLFKRHEEKNGDKMAVFDSYLDEGDVMALRQFVLHNSTFEYDLAQTGTDNVKWLAGFEERYYVQSQLYEELQKVVDFFTGRTTYHPYDVSCNVIRSADNTHIHQDCEPGEDDVTLLIYLNPNWTRNMYGETVFYEKDEQGNYESKLAVRPRFGRISIFNGLFPHAARPPSSTFLGARYTFAVKYAPNKELAKAKDSAASGDYSEINASNAEMVLEEMRQTLSEDLTSVPGKEGIFKTIQAWSDRIARGESIPSAEVSDLLDEASELGAKHIRDEL